jgi:hypothetical protein
MTVEYIVVGDHTLGYRQAGSTSMGVLAGSVIRGGHDPKNGPVEVMDGVDRIRLATLHDFAFFRVSPRGHLQAP